MTLYDFLLLAQCHFRNNLPDDRDECQRIYVSPDEFVKWYIRRENPKANRRDLLGQLRSLGFLSEVPVHKSAWG